MPVAEDLFIIGTRSPLRRSGNRKGVRERGSRVRGRFPLFASPFSRERVG